MQSMLLVQLLKILSIVPNRWKLKSEYVLVSKTHVKYSMYSPYEIRSYNDQLLQLERAFLNPLGQGPEYSDFK